MKGFIALSSILVIGAVLLSIGISVSLLSISESQVSFAEKKKNETVNFVESCIEDALVRLNANNAVPTAIPLPGGQCTIVINSQSGANWTFTATATLDTYRKSVQVTATRTSQVVITSWKEVP